MLRRHFLPHIRPFWRQIALATLSLVGATGLTLLKPWPLRFLFDDVLVNPARQSGLTLFVFLIGTAIVLIAVGEGLLSFVKEFFLNAASERIKFALRTTIFAHVERLPLSFFQTQRTGDLVTRVTQDADKALELLADESVSSLSGLLTLAGIIVVVLAIDWQLALVMLIAAPILFMLLIHFRRRIRSEAEDLRYQEGQMASLAQETLSGIKVVKSYGNEEYVEEKFRGNAAKALDASLRVARIDARFGWLLTMAVSLGVAAVVVLGAFHVMAGIITVGILVVFVSYVRDFYSPLRSFSRLSMKFTRARVRLERIAELLEQAPELEATPSSRPAPPFGGLVHFEEVSFAYNPGYRVLNEISFAVHPGGMVALVGPTGSGKSTLAGLVPRLYDPLEGRVLIDGEDIRSFTLRSLRSQVATVLQETVLFQATVLENISYGRPGATREEIEAASRASGAHKFIADLPNGYDTVLAERGGTLSGGQRQLVAIARALVKDAPILILDEPTAGLDAIAEGEVIEAMKKLMAGRTTLLITHHLGLVEHAEKIVVLDGGRLIESGTHSELIGQGGLYARLHAVGSDQRKKT